jgi:hypothetical protein
VTVKMPSQGLRFRGHVVASLPASALDALHPANRATTARSFVTQTRQIVDLGTVVDGSAQLEIAVREAPSE